MQAIQKLGMIRKLSFPGAKAININITNTVQKRFINQCLHVKGLPTTLTSEEIYTFMKEYGSVQEIASYPEAPKFESGAKSASDVLDQKRKNFITHDRLPGLTAIVRFHNVQSAIMCKDELHWRPYPHENYELTEEVIKSNPRDRPLVNILFETGELFERLRPWVRRDLFGSRKWIAKIEGRPVEEGSDRGLRLMKKQQSERKEFPKNGSTRTSTSTRSNLNKKTVRKNPVRRKRDEPEQQDALEW